MLALSKNHDLREFDDRLRDAPEVTAELMSEILAEARLRSPSVGRGGESARLDRLIQSGAWTDAALVLIELELPLWQVRRIAYDEGEWYCALSRDRELPDWLDRSIEAHHADLSLAILSAFVDARLAAMPSNRSSVPFVPHELNPLYEPVMTDNFA
jgi:hypothetical protein